MMPVLLLMAKAPPVFPVVIAQVKVLPASGSVAVSGVPTVTLFAVFSAMVNGPAAFTTGG